MLLVDWRLYIEIHEDDKTPEDRKQDLVGLLLRNMYGFRDASSGRQRDWPDLLTTVQCEVGIANPTLFFQRREESGGLCHGDGFGVLAIKRIWTGYWLCLRAVIQFTDLAGAPLHSICNPFEQRDRDLEDPRWQEGGAD